MLQPHSQHLLAIVTPEGLRVQQVVRHKPRTLLTWEGLQSGLQEEQLPKMSCGRCAKQVW